MSELEIKQEEKKCLCQSEGFRNTVTIALGSFIGVFCALSLFAALHKPPMMMPNPYFMHRPCPCHHHKMMKEFRKHHPDFAKNPEFIKKHPEFLKKHPEFNKVDEQKDD